MEKQAKQIMKVGAIGFGVAAAIALVLQIVVIPHGTLDMNREYTYPTQAEATAAVEGNELPEEIVENGQTYVLNPQAITYEARQSVPFYKVARHYDGLPSQEVNITCDVTVNGKVYSLPLISADYTQEDVDYNATSETEYTGQVDRPQNVPATDGVTYLSADNKPVTVTGDLISLEKTSEDYTLTTIERAQMVLPQGAKAFEYGGREIFYNAQNPRWEGYQEDFIQSFGFNPSLYTVTDAQWANNGHTDADGNFVRDINVSVERKVADWTATYQATGTRPVYTADATYGGTTEALEMPAESATGNEATIVAIAKYTLKRVTESGLIGTLARNNMVLPCIACLLGFAAGGCAYFGARKEKNEK